MLVENLQTLVGQIPPGCEDVAFALGCLAFLYILDEFISFLKICFRGLR